MNEFFQSAGVEFVAVRELGAVEIQQPQPLRVG
jgi:hypothetical protein